ncbi:MAG: hypothetical protein E6G97_22590 [Alphaproteobacteria bacterium]|nr:MAG: hypothetical protein E6G97_22590 [Alphaproteobacteria bacterium]
MPGNPPACPPHPPIGPTGDSTDDIGKTFLAILGVLGTIGTVVGAAIEGTKTGTIAILGVAGDGVGAIGLSAVAAAVAVATTVLAFWIDRCLSNPTGEEACSAGVIDTIVPSFNDATSYFFPFSAQHDLVSVVTQCQYWPLIQQNAGFIHVNATDNSPAIHCYFKSKPVCTAAGGAFVGAVVGGVAGIVVGIIAGAALGCAASGPFYILCLLLACLIAALIAAACALFGAFLGGSIGHAIGGSGFLTVDSGAEPFVGDYITTCGNTIIYGNDEHARVYWFVEHSALHGASMAPAGQQWIHADPDQNLPLDTCQSLCPGNFTGIQDPPGGGDGPAGGPPR